MNRLKFLLTAFVVSVISLGFYSCTKDEILKGNKNLKTQTRTNAFNHNFVKGDGGFRPEFDYGPNEGQPIKTVLGTVRNNPYSVQNMTAAWNKLYKENLSTLPKTYLHQNFSFIRRRLRKIETIHYE